jgi:16S rRNA (guanine527-N7)-methyltransferase
MNNQEFEAFLRGQCSGLSSEVVGLIARYRDIVIAGNERQNLTRLTSPTDFFDGHVRDVLEMMSSGLVCYPAMDLGSGAGVPGILAAIMGSGQWVLAESEGRKAEFLREAVANLGLSGVSVFAGRGEQYLRSARVESVVAKAVGAVEKIYGWIRKCSTWNNLVLFKSRGWEEEWKTFCSTRQGSELKIDGQHEYAVGKAGKVRIIVRLARVRRVSSRG